MSIVLGFSSFAVFFVLMCLIAPAAGLIGALVASLLPCRRMVWRGQSEKILEIGSLILFMLFTVYTLLAAPNWTVAVGLAVDRSPAEGQQPSRSFPEITGVSILCLLSRNSLPYITSCLTEIRFVTDICDTKGPEADEVSPG